MGQEGQEEGEFTSPCHCLDARGRLYVGDRAMDHFEVFDPDGKFLDEWREAGRLRPFLAADGRLFVADGRANRVTILDRSGKALGHWG